MDKIAGANEYLSTTRRIVSLGFPHKVNTPFAAIPFLSDGIKTHISSYDWFGICDRAAGSGGRKVASMTLRPVEVFQSWEKSILPEFTAKKTDFRRTPSIDCRGVVLGVIVLSLDLPVTARFATRLATVSATLGTFLVCSTAPCNMFC